MISFHCKTFNLYLIGVGKTELIRNLAEDYEINFYSVSPADIYGKYIGER